jgi:hypothetical protein
VAGAIFSTFKWSENCRVTGEMLDGSEEQARAAGARPHATSGNQWQLPLLLLRTSHA